MVTNWTGTGVDAAGAGVVRLSKPMGFMRDRIAVERMVATGARDDHNQAVVEAQTVITDVPALVAGLSSSSEELMDKQVSLHVNKVYTLSGLDVTEKDVVVCLGTSVRYEVKGVNRPPGGRAGGHIELVVQEVRA